MSDQTQREREALARALEMLGFDAEKVVGELLKGGPAEYWASLSLDASRVTFDGARARELEPGLSPVAEAAAHSWWLAARPGEETVHSTFLFLPAREYDVREFEQLRLTPDDVKRINVTEGVR